MIFRFLRAIFIAILAACLAGVLIVGGTVMYIIVITAPFWAQVLIAAAFAFIVYLGVKERDDDGETEE